MQLDEMIVSINEEGDVGRAALQVLTFCRTAGFTSTRAYMVATAVSEMGTNIWHYAQKGEIRVKVIAGDKDGIEIIAEDKGPGIEDIEAAMRDHYSTSNSLGVGLPGIRRLMDEFEIQSNPAQGTRIVVRKWLA